MKRNTVNILFKILIFIMLIFAFTGTYSKANVKIEEEIKIAMLNPDDFEPGAITGYDSVIEKGSIIIDVIRVIGIIVTVISLLILGIKFMTGSVEEKAEYKKTMIPYFIGVIIFFSLSTILTTIIELVADL